MKRVLLTFCCLLACRTIAGQQPPDSAAVQRYLLAQQRARTMARRLVDDSLNAQLRQMEENGLQDLALYADVRVMRDNINGLIDGEMQQAISLLQQADTGSDEQRRAAFEQGREAMQRSMERLTKEREKLLIRLRSARLADDLGRVLTLQVQVYDDTQQLGQLPSQQQEAKQLTTLQDQRSVQTLFQSAHEMMTAATSWAPPGAARAQRCLEIVAEKRVIESLDNAQRQLAAAQYDGAGQSQRAVIDAIELMRHQFADDDRQQPADALGLLDTLIARQRQLQANTRQADLSQEAARDELSTKQHDIYESTRQLPPIVRSTEPMTALVDQAIASAFAAETELFNGNQTLAVSLQGQVIDSLTKLRQEVAIALAAMMQAGATESDQRDQLRELDADLERIEGNQQRVQDALAENSADAARQQQQVADELGQLQSPGDLGNLQDRLNDAQAAAADAQRALQNEQLPLAARQQAADDANQAIQAARAEVSQQLSSAQRSPPRDVATDADRDQNSDQEARPNNQQQNAAGNQNEQPNQQSLTQQNRRDGTPTQQPTAATDDSSDDVRVTPRRFENEPWFLQLPPELRESLNSRTRRPPPKGYEERLRRYFESRKGR